MNNTSNAQLTVIHILIALTKKESMSCNTVYISILYTVKADQILVQVKMDVSFVPPPDPHLADYIVITIFLCICLGIGFYYGYYTNKNPSMENYFFGNRRLQIIPVAMSNFVTSISAIGILGVPADIYVYGIRIIFAGIAYCISMIIASLTIIPLLYPMQLSSTYEYLEMRFKSKGVRTLGVVIGILQTVFYMGITLFAPALALQTVADIPLWVSIVVIGFICTIYTTIGGIKSVVWTDVFQCGVMFIGLVSVLIKGSSLVGPHHVLTEVATKGRRLEFFNFDLDPRVRHTTWGLVFGMPFTILPNWCNQASIQRFSSLRNLTSAYKVTGLMVLIAVILHVIIGYLGILMYSYYNILGCDPVQAGYVTTFNQIVPYFVLDVLRSIPGLSGVFISCLFSGALSTLSSGINALSVNTVEDILGNVIKRLNKISQTSAAKSLVVGYGLMVIRLAYSINFLPGSMIQMVMVVFGACGGPLAGLYFLGGMVPIANYIGALVGTVTALILNMWIATGGMLHGKRRIKLPQNPTTGCILGNVTGTVTAPTINTIMYNITTNKPEVGSVPSDEGFVLYDVSYLWYGFIGFSITLIIGSAVSVCTGDGRGEPVEPHLIFPIVRKLLGIQLSDKRTEAESLPLSRTPEDSNTVQLD
ncbi:sodium-dependent multivitamin transporter-like [Argopecten irradians]|uniref:sodium-dependent multivitamin transporter-like n=1 Tax=Argopecten irradians TaxID=31199 RepID=UPI00371CAD4B